jgi:chromate transporter
MSLADSAPTSPRLPGTPAEVFRAFLPLGFTSFGGPVAHLGYFREAFVTRLGWLGEQAYADLVALCQFLPGPASSQVGMALGLMRGGWLGMLAAWTAFTLPSALALALFALGVSALGDAAGSGWLAGLKAAAVAVVAHAVLGMARSLTPDAPRASIAVAAMAAALLVPGPLAQVAAILLGAAIGLAVLRPQIDGSAHEPLTAPVSRPVAVGALAMFFLLLAMLPVLAAGEGGVLGLIDGFYRAGALVFGGGHVVLPLLQAEMVDGMALVDRETFLAGYGAAQAVPGPLFTFSAYLGAASSGAPSGFVGAMVALLAIFLPSALLVVGGLTFWESLRSAPLARRALMGVNAAVVGLLSAALYDPVFTEGVTGAPTMLVAAAAFVALTSWKTPAWAVVVAAGLAGFALPG